MSMEAAVNTLRRFCIDIGKDADFEKLNRRQLNELLCLFYSDVQKCRRKSNRNNNEGQNYSKATVNAIRYGLYKYISSINSRIDIIHDPEFDEAEDAFKARLDVIDKKTTSIVQVISVKDVKRLYRLTSVFDVSNPVGLQSKVLFEVLVYLCQGDKMSLRDMKQDSFKTKIDSAGKRYVTLVGKDKSAGEAERMYENLGNHLCPVASFQKYMSRLNPLCSSFWQQPRKITDVDQLVWYDCTPLDAPILNGMMTEISKNAQLSKTYKNEDIIATSPSLVKNEIYIKAKIVELSGSDSDGNNSSDDERSSHKSSTSTTGKANTSGGSGANMPGFFPGTTWPTDSTLELLINYEAVKEVRTVKKQFYPLLYHLTRTDYDSIAKSMSTIKPLMELLKSRFTPSKPVAPSESTKSETVLDGKATNRGNQIRKDTAIITDIQEAKRELLKLFTRMDLKRQDFAKVLCWMQKLEIKVGRSGDQYISDVSDEKPTFNKPKGPVNLKKKRSVLPDPPQVTSRLRTRGKPADTSKKASEKTKIEPRVTRTRTKKLPQKRVSEQRKPASLKVKITNLNTATPKFTPAVSVSKKKEMEKSKENTKKGNNKKKRGRPAPKVSDSNDTSTSESEEDEENISKASDVNALDQENDFIPNKRFRMAEQAEQNEMDELYVEANEPVPVCLYKVEGDDDKDDDDAPMIIESETWFPPPQVEIENLEGGNSIKRESDDVDMNIKAELFERSKDTESVQNASTNFEELSNSVNAITSSVSVQEPVPLELQMTGTDIHVSTIAPANEELINSSSATAMPLTDSSQDPFNVLPAASSADDFNILSDAYQEPLAPVSSGSDSKGTKPTRSIRTCLGDTCLGEDCPHDHIVVSKSSQNLATDLDSIVITRNTDQETECIDLQDDSDNEETESTMASSVVKSSSPAASELSTIYQSPESTMPTSENQVTSANDIDQPQSIADITVKKEVTSFPAFDDGKEADPIIIIDDD